ncbi:ATP-binding protein [bacterium]|nr:ATP-binding protein [bacterium]
MIQRKILDNLKEHLSQKEISLIIGPRQAGKTTVMLLLKDYLDKRGESTLFLSLDFEEDKQFFVSQRSLINKMRLEIGEEKGYVFIDEIQRKENAGLFLKGLYDLNLPYKFIVSGSGSIELKEKIHESLIGRKRIFQLDTVSFDEFVNFKTNYRYKDKLPDFFCIEKDKTKEFLIEYLNFGGYPRLILETELKEKRVIIDDIYHSLLEKDIAFLLKVEKMEAFSSLIKVLASQIGRLVNHSELSSTLGISIKTLKNYLWYARKTFVIQKITPFFRNIRKEITKSPVVYFYDLGLRNYTLGRFGNLAIPSELGFVFQNFVLNLLRDKLRFIAGEIHFWRTKDKAEVDFIINVGEVIVPVEVKFKEFKKAKIESSLRNFILKYEPKQAWVINLSLREKIKFNKTEVQFLPFYNLSVSSDIESFSAAEVRKYTSSFQMNLKNAKNKT